jgi:flagellar motility protein MotE (MotC chaperone)
MKKILQVLSMVLAINFLAVLGGVGWLMQSGHLDRARARAVKLVLFPTTATTEPTTEPADAAPATQPFVNLDDLLARHAGKRAGEQVEIIQQSFDEQSAQLDRRKRELDALAEQVGREQKRLADAGTSLEQARKQLDEREKQDESRASDKGFQDTLKLYTSMPAPQVKKVFMSLPVETVVNYLQAMQPRNAAKIIKEFKTKDETDLIQKVLEKMRQGGPPPAPDGPTPADSGVGAGPAQANGPNLPK